jgi:adenylate cyclase
MAQQPITILFADISGSTKLFESRGDLEARAITSQVLNMLTAITQSNGGRVIKTIGDEIMCTFPGAMAGLHAAVEMQKRTSVDPLCMRERLGVRIGLHHGEALLEDGDVYGDAVNTAARMTGLAKREQIVTTAVTIRGLTNYGQLKTRNLGPTLVSGKLQPIDTVDVMWQDDNSNVTMVAKAIRLEDVGLGHKLTLRCKGIVIEISERSQSLGLGRDPSNQVVVDNEWVSRNHATIEFQRGHFVVTDRSTNGTFVKLGDDDEIRLHRDSLQLRKSGAIGLGQATSKDIDSAVYFQCG